MTVTLRPYQAEPARAILRDARLGGGNTFTVLMSRQAGKNELSAWIEKVLLVANMANRAAVGVKTAPTLTPQLRNSIRRLRAHLDAAGLRGAYELEDGHLLSLGGAAWNFLSASPGASVLGATASLLLEADEAQDIDPDRFTKDFRPMAASTAATTVLYGTPWAEDDLLLATVAENKARERKDGLRRHFEYPWPEVAKHVPAYARYVAAERIRLGPTHPLFTSQYDLTPLPGTGRLLSPAQLTNLQGSHYAKKGETHAAGLDVAGEETDPLSPRDRDHNVLWISRVTPGPKHSLPLSETVAIYTWQGTGHDALYAHLHRLLTEVWNIAHVAVDATGGGEGMAILLARSLGQHKVTGYKFTEQSKSHLGYQLQAAANTTALTLWKADGSAEHNEAVRQLRLCRAEYRPNRTVRWHVAPSQGHDDYVAAAALAVEAATKAQPRTARGRIP